VHCCTLQEKNVTTGIQMCTKKKKKKKKECDEQRNESFLVNRERARGLFVCKIQYNKPTNERTIFRLDLLVLFLLLLPMLPNYHEWQKKLPISDKISLTYPFYADLFSKIGQDLAVQSMTN
jgi:hypothetical protein